jgi:signal transduction histidine kinase
MATIAITDNGKGVRLNIRDQLFRQPIVHEEVRKPGGRGHGLWLVGYVTELYGGHCRLAWSEPGQGSTFVIHLPVAIESEVLSRES